MPWANSKPVRPKLQAASASRARVTPAWAVRVFPSPAWISLRFARLTTRRSSPPSGAKRLVPLPRIKGRAPKFSAAAMRAVTSASVLGKAMRFAGPPVRKEVWRLMGSPLFHSRPGRFAAAQRSNSCSHAIGRPPLLDLDDAAQKGGADDAGIVAKLRPDHLRHPAAVAGKALRLHQLLHGL